MDRSAINTALAKCIAYIGCGKPDQAEDWFRTLARLLGYSHLLK